MSAHRATRGHQGLTLTRLGITVPPAPTTRRRARQVRDLDLAGVLAATVVAR